MSRLYYVFNGEKYLTWTCEIVKGKAIHTPMGCFSVQGYGLVDYADKHNLELYYIEIS
jgi:hypothetical protein